MNRLSVMAESLMAVVTQHHRMTIAQLAVFCDVAAHPGCSSNDVCERLGLAPGTVARALGILSSQGYQGTKPLELIEKKLVGRTNELRLTANGTRLATLLTRSINDDDTSKEG